MSWKDPGPNEELHPLAPETPNAPPPSLPATALVPSDQEVLVELQRLTRRTSRWSKTLFVILVSCTAFYLVGLLTFRPSHLIIITGVIFIHEMGHVIAMKCFGYRDLRIVFIPLIGGAAIGRKGSRRGWQRAIISLAGPVPSLLLGYGMLLLHFTTSVEWVGTAAALLIILNAINLLPLFPMDGGQLMNEVLFTRHRYVEAASKMVAAALLLFVGVIAQSTSAMIFGMLILMGTLMSMGMSGTIETMRRCIPPDSHDPDGDIPEDVARQMLAVARQKLSAKHRARTFAAMISAAWKRQSSNPPGTAASIGLLTLYAASIISAVVLPLLLLILAALDVLPTPHSGWDAQFIEGFRRGFNKP